MDKQKTGELIAKIRKEQNITKLELADSINLAFSQRYWS